MQPMPPDVFDRLLAVRDSIPGAEGVFVPYVGSRYGQGGAARLMLVGKATAKWEPGDTLGVQRKEAKQFVHNKVKTGEYDSAFWRFLDRLTAAVNGTEEPGNLDTIVWTNLMKIPVNGGNPTGPAASAQREIAASCLRNELETLAPECVVITANNYEGNFIERMFGSNWDKNESALGTWKTVGPTGARICWTMHPEWKSRDVLDRIVSVIAADFRARRT